MHICIVSQEYPPETNWGGIATYSSDIAYALHERGHKVTVITRSVDYKEYNNQRDGVSVYRILPTLAKYYNLPGFRHVYRQYDAYAWSVFTKLKEIHEKDHIDIIETPNLHGEAIFWQLFGPRVPVVVRMHSSSTQNRQLNNKPLNFAAKLDYWQEKLALRKANAISAVSKSVIKYNKKLVPINIPMQVIGNPLAQADMVQLPFQKSEDAQILYAGRLSNRKGLPILVDAIPKILAACPKAKFTIAGADGQGPNGGSMQKWAETQLSEFASSVDFTGMLNRKEILRCYKEAQIVVFPTRFEPFGYIVTEAMASGGIIVASNLDGPSEIIDHERTGLLFEPGNPVDLAEKVISVFKPNFPLAQMRQAAFEEVKKKYSPTIIAAQVEQLYESVISR